MTDEHSSTDPGVEGTVARPGGVSYLRIPARDVARSAEFYRAVFGWRLRGRPDAPSFSDGTGHVIGHWRTDLPAAGEAGVLPYVYVTSLDDTLRAAAEHGAELVTRPTRKEACRSPPSAIPQATSSASGRTGRADPRRSAARARPVSVRCGVSPIEHAFRHRTGEGMMHPMFVKLFIENDADELLDEEETRRRSARRSRRSRPAMVVTAAARRRSSRPER